MKLWRWLRGGHWERWYVDSPVNSTVWHRVDECTYDAAIPKREVRRRPTPLCRGTAECEDYLTWPERIDVWRGLGGPTRPYEDVRRELGLGYERALPRAATAELDALSWTCHFCGEMRPDEMIGTVLVVRNLRGIGGTLIPIHFTRRYCKDRALCWERAKRWSDELKIEGSIEAAGECP